MHNLAVLSLFLLIVSFGLKKKHFLIMLLSLEFLGIFIIILTLIIGLEVFLGFIMVCIGACEGAVGLGSLIRSARVKNNHITAVY